MTRTVAYPVLEPCQQVMERARQVQIEEGALEALGLRLAEHPPRPAAWSDPYLHPGIASPGQAAAEMLMLTAINFSFWGRKPRWQVGGQDGAYGLAAAFQRAREKGVATWDAAWFAQITDAQAAELLAGDEPGPPEPPLLEARSVLLREMGEYLWSEWRGDALALLGSVADAMELAQRLAQEVAGFRDVESYQGIEVAFLKRAMLASHACSQVLGEHSPAGLSDRSRLEVFADYKLPQVLRHLGVLEYVPELARRVDSEEELEVGEEAEVEIRAATVVCGRRLVEIACRYGVETDCGLVDGWLWSAGQGLAAKPYHRVRTIWY